MWFKKKCGRSQWTPKITERKAGQGAGGSASILRKCQEDRQCCCEMVKIFFPRILGRGRVDHIAKGQRA